MCGRISAELIDGKEKILGINVSSIKYLALIKNKFRVSFDKLAMLGRQNLVISDINLLDVCNLLGYKNSIDSLKERDGYSENLFFNLFKSEKVNSVDYCDYEGAMINLDLNESMPSTYDESYDLIYDGAPWNIFLIIL